MPAQDGWRVRLAMARVWRDTVNRHGGDETVVHLPEIGIRGNTHVSVLGMAAWSGRERRPGRRRLTRPSWHEDNPPS